VYLFYVYCHSCGHEEQNAFCAYSRTTASGNSYFCNGCNTETEDVVESEE